MKAEMRLTNSERWKVDGEVVKGLAEVEKKKKNLCLTESQRISATGGTNALENRVELKE